MIMVYLQYSNKREALTTVNAIYTIKIKLSKILITYKDKIVKDNNIETYWQLFHSVAKVFLKRATKADIVLNVP